MAAEAEVSERTLTSRDGTRLFARDWAVDSPRAWVAVAHGLGEHSGRYERLATALQRYGFACSAVDLRGMGRSQGRRGHVRRWSEWVEDYASFYATVVEQAQGVEVVPLGHSFGGVLLTTAVLHEAIRPERFVLSNPAFWPARLPPKGKVRLARLASRLLPALTQGNQVDPETISRDPAAVAEYRADPLVHDRLSARLFTEWSAASEEALARAAEVQIPFFLIVGARDELIDPRGAAEFSSRATVDHAMRLYQGRYHEPFNDLGAEEVFADLAAWLEAGG